MEHPGQSSSNRERRFVVFLGPYKTASTTLEFWLADHLHGENKAEALADWDFPLLYGDPNGLYRVVGGGKRQYQVVQDTLKQYANSTRNMLMGTEALIEFDGKGKGLLYKLCEWINFDSSKLELVIQHRVPKISHFLSSWKQQTHSPKKPAHGFSFRRWVCDPWNTKRLVERLEQDLNGVSKAAKLVDPNGNYRLRTYLLDMSGIQKAEMDVCHAFSCQVLRVNCTSSYLLQNSENQGNTAEKTYGQQWVQGLEGEVLHKNSLQYDPGLSEHESAALDEILTQRDCAFYPDLVNNSLLTVLYRHKLWFNNCAEIFGNPDKYKDALIWRKDVHAMTERIRQVLSCSNTESWQPGTVPMTPATQGDDLVQVGVMMYVEPPEEQMVVNSSVILHPHNATTLLVTQPMELWQHSGEFTSRWLGHIELAVLLLVTIVLGVRRLRVRKVNTRGLLQASHRRSDQVSSKAVTITSSPVFRNNGECHWNGG